VEIAKFDIVMLLEFDTHEVCQRISKKFGMAKYGRNL
jgi:hypothetical protein